MNFTRRQYRFLAEWIKSLPEEGGRASTAMSLADLLASNNSGFNWDRFIKIALKEKRQEPKQKPEQKFKVTQSIKIVDFNKDF